MTDKLSNGHQPPAEIKIVFCPMCGRNDMVRNLSSHHFVAGKLCHGKLRTITYVPKESHD